MSVHIEGMGVSGSMIAWNLYDAGVVFTWHDIESDVQAWRACTGMIYPSGERDDQRAYNVWARWLRNPPWPIHMKRWIEVADFWYISIGTPHGLRNVDPVVDLGYMRKLPMPSIHLNAQAFVSETRSFFENQRMSARDDSAETVIVSHGFGNRGTRYNWGWSVVAELEISNEILEQSHNRPTLYLREGKFKGYYALAMPDTQLYYCGSDSITQSVPRELQVTPKLSKWIDHLKKVTDGKVSLKKIIEVKQGWRPRRDEGDDDLVSELDGALCCAPMGSSGVRHSPLLVDAVLRRIGLEGVI